MTRARMNQPEAVTGVQLARGIGHQEAKGFWLDAWSQVIRRPMAVAGLVWIGIALFFAIFSPLIANGYPLRLVFFDRVDAAGSAQAFMAAVGPGDVPESKVVHAIAQINDMNSARAPVGELLTGMPPVPKSIEDRSSARSPIRPTYSADQIRAIASAMRAYAPFDETGGVASVTSPLVEHLTASDITLLVIGVAAPFWMLLPMRLPRTRRLLILLTVCGQAGLVVAIASAVASYSMQRDAAEWVRSLQQSKDLAWLGSAVVAGVLALPFFALPVIRRVPLRIVVVAAVSFSAAIITTNRWTPPLQTFPYRDLQAAGEVQATYTLVPFSPTQASTSWFHKKPGTTLSEIEGDRFDPGAGDATFVLGTDGVGQDVLSQMMHACRLSISIGLVSTSIAVIIGVTMGALMGYFGGFVDLALFRIVEIFMAIPVLFLLIVAAGVLPPEFRSTYTMMAIIGCFTWHGAARFTRAEFLKLRSQDFVQSARAVGLPLRAILFKHMLPNGVTPVLVEASFMIAAAILIEAILSYLGLGPVGQPSWGSLLSTATSETGTFVWWLAIYPGFAIFFTVLAFTLVGEALRDAIDPKLKKARV